MFKRLKTLLLPVTILAATLGVAPNATARLAETRVGGYQLFAAASRLAHPSQVPESQQASGFLWYDTASECSVAAKTPLKYHYTTAEEASFKGGLWRDTSVTDKLYTDPLKASQELGIPVPNKVIPIKDAGQFVPNKPPIVQPSYRYQGGGTDFINPEPVPPEYLLPAKPLGGG